MYQENAGTIGLDGGYRFIWNRGSGDGEIFGSIQKPDGSIMKGLSGWYRTTDPALASKEASKLMLLV